MFPDLKMTTRSRRGKVKDGKSEAEEVVETTVKENGDAEIAQEAQGKKKNKNKKGNTSKKGTVVEKEDKFELLSRCGGYLVLAQGSEVRCTVNLRQLEQSVH